MVGELWIVAALLAFAAGYVQGFTGFGFAVVFTPLLVLLFGIPQQIILLSLMLGSLLSIGVLIEVRLTFSARRMWPLLAGAALGTPVGTALLVMTDARTLKLLVACSTIVLATAWLLRLPPPFKRESRALGVASFVGGFLNGSTSMGGPPPALVVSAQRWPTPQARAGLVSFNLLSYAVALTIAAATGIAQPRFLLPSAWLVLPAAAGTIAGAWSVRRLPQHVFRTAVVSVVALTGLVGLLSLIGR